jgi:hypothetical protein
VEERRKGETHERARSPRLVGPGWGVARRGDAMGAGARRAHELSTKIRPKASQARGLLLPFIFATSPCLIRFDRDRPSRFLYIRAAATKIAINQQTRKHQHI